MRTWLAISLLLLLARPVMSAESLPREVEYTNDGFSITLPPGWMEVVPARHELRFAAEDRLGTPLPGRLRIFQIETQTNLAPAFVLVCLREGRFPDFLMRSLLGTNNNRAHLMEVLRAEKITPNNVRSVSFDTNRCVLQSDAVREGTSGRQRVLTKTFFTEDGTLTVSGVTSELDYSQWWATLGQIVDSVNVPARTRYRVRPPPNLSSGSRDWMILGAGLLGVVLLAVVAHRFNTSGGSSVGY